MDLNQFDYYLILDVAATCCDREAIPRRQMETIEIGAVMVEAKELTVVDEFQTFVKPVRHPVLTEFCRSLTSITQAKINRVARYPRAIDRLKTWLSDYESAVFGSWGRFDYRQFRIDSDFHNVPFPIAYPHINLKQAFSEAQGLPKRLLLADALRLAGIEPQGTPYRAIDDAKNIAKLLPYALSRKQLTEAASPTDRS